MTSLKDFIVRAHGKTSNEYLSHRDKKTESFILLNNTH